MTSVDQYIGIDVGGTKIMGVIGNPDDGTIAGQHKAATPSGNAQEIASAIGDVIAHLVDGSGPDAQPIAIGVGLPGLVDHDGVLHYGPNVPGVLGLDIASELRERFTMPVFAINDASCAAIAEHRLGAARGHDHAVVITQGTGIGGAIIVDGKLVRGAHGFAGEPGHMLVDSGGYRCACGKVGCWETVSSGAGLMNIGQEFAAQGRALRILELAGGEAVHIRGEHVSQALAEGDRDAGDILDRFVNWVAEGIGSLISLLDPGVVVLGGGLTVISEHFLDDVRERVEAATVGGRHRPTVAIRPAELGPEAGAIGAAINARDSVAGR